MDIENIKQDIDIIQVEVDRLDNNLFLLNNDNEKLKLILAEEIKDYKQKLNRYRLVVVSLFCFCGCFLLIFRGVRKYVWIKI